ncbi:hypothetical protein [Halegenticoccus soli]|uniref:hypothetical protein n=1 Tax=Halegenticoccus soli TaxID=1985678 RepID=UPI001E312031|nr:hypothetical protein [Halegenticoccus soli]
MTDEPIIPTYPIDGCWQTTLVRFSVPDVIRNQSLDPGERIQAEYAVLYYPEREILEATMDIWNASSVPSDKGCLLAGEYRFEESFMPRRRRDKHWEDFSWGFTLTLSE